MSDEDEPGEVMTEAAIDEFAAQQQRRLLLVNVAGAVVTALVAVGLLVAFVSAHAVPGLYTGRLLGASIGFFVVSGMLVFRGYRLRRRPLPRATVRR
ncbi:hypothetical protein BH11MYX1_BH11MYX1_07670 [soil metagenome]